MVSSISFCYFDFGDFFFFAVAWKRVKTPNHAKARRAPRMGKLGAGKETCLSDDRTARELAGLKLSGGKPLPGLQTAASCP